MELPKVTRLETGRGRTAPALSVLATVPTPPSWDSVYSDEGVHGMQREGEGGELVLQWLLGDSELPLALPLLRRGLLSPTCNLALYYSARCPLRRPSLKFIFMASHPPEQPTFSFLKDVLPLEIP